MNKVKKYEIICYIKSKNLQFLICHGSGDKKAKGTKKRHQKES